MSSAQDFLRGIKNLVQILGAQVFSALRQPLENLSEALDLQEIELTTLRAVNDDLSGQLTARDQTIVGLLAENQHLRALQQPGFHRKPICLACWISGANCDLEPQCAACVAAGVHCERKRCKGRFCQKERCPRVHPGEFAREQTAWVVTDGRLPAIDHRESAGWVRGEEDGEDGGGQGYWGGEVVTGQ